MELYLPPDLEKQLADAAEKVGRPVNELAQDVIAGYLGELAEVRGTVDSRYDELKSGAVKPIDGQAFFESLRQQEEDLLKRS